MASTDPAAKTSGLSAQVFDLLKVVLTLVLTGLIGGGITYYYQNRSQRDQQEAKELETARNSALIFLREVGDILEQRRASAFRCLYAMRDKAPQEETDRLWKEYMTSVDAWNAKWNLYRALVLEEFGPEMQSRFYDEKTDAEGVWTKSSITGKLILFHQALVDFRSKAGEKTPADAEQIERLYSSIAQDCYGFYSEVINRIQEGRVGKRSWTVVQTQGK
jgi:hypothetical protein